MGDAIVSAYRATLGQQSESDPSGLARVEANITLAELRPTFMHALEQLLKRHVAHWSRPLDSGAARGYDTRTVAVGFMDLVGSTALAARLSTEELSGALSEFEATSGDIIVGSGGRVVKLIGDEVMFTHADTSAMCTIASGLVAAFDTHPVLGGVRVGIAHGDVLTRDGDSFGPVVNLAARIVAVAQPGQVLVDDASAAAAASAWTFIPAGSHTFKGFAESTSVHQLVTPAA
jgi:class 3 adenylate cyclase